VFEDLVELVALAGRGSDARSGTDRGVGRADRVGAVGRAESLGLETLELGLFSAVCPFQVQMFSDCLVEDAHIALVTKLFP